MTALNAIIQGIIQGLTEFLPISSSGHLSLFQYFTGQNESGGLMFSIFLHMGTLLAVFIAFYKKIIALIKEFCVMLREIVQGGSKNKSEGESFFKSFMENANPERRMVVLLIISMLPMVISLFLKDYFELVATDNDIIFEGCCFVVTSILLFMADNCVHGHKTAENMKYRDAVIIGTVQSLAPFPGISRSGSTISAGLMVGLEREYAVAFSFIMGIPPVLGANIMELSKAGQQDIAIPAGMILIGMAVALVFGLLAIGMVKWLVNSQQFGIFAWYTLILGILTIGVGIFERLTGHMLQDLVSSLMQMRQ